MTKIDVRLARTKQKLFDAYVELLQKEHSESITIQALTSKASVNRVTFYKHFSNSANFHEQFIHHYILELYHFMKPLNYKTYEKGFEYDSLIQLLQHISDKKDLYKILFTSENITDFNKQLLAYFQSRITKHTEELAKFDFPGINVDQEIVSWYGVSALFGTIILWVQSNFKYSPKELADAIVKLTPHHE
jgi:AcrR family transcriptional regulator